MNRENVLRILHCFQSRIDEWDSGRTDLPAVEDPLEQRVLQVLHFNYRLWNQEDVARRRDVEDQVIVDTKRRIDSLNQSRNDAIEKVDDYLLSEHYGHLAEQPLPMRTETPGSAFDRLTILAMKISRMRQQTERQDADPAHIEQCRQKLETLLRQREDLQNALLDLLADLDAASIRMQVYRQYKMYNDPKLNPQLYNAANCKTD